MESEKLLVKENVSRASPLSLVWLTCACAAAGASLVAATLVDRALPAPLTRAAPNHRFIAEIAHEHLVNLTNIGPRVAGSYENEVLGVGVVVGAVREIARSASPHVRVELDVQTASGAFPLAFLDGMNHIYQDVSNVVVRLSGAGGSPRPVGGEGRSALLLNCHIDTVPDSPGASDDGAGCAVLLETLRALATARAPPRHAAIFLFNAAEENILQASHGFITQHKWAKQVRAFINIEACGAGGREVMFQAGPHDPWIVETYAGAVPHPFASSLAQELFESGLIPADTDFRIFRDFGNLSGVDLAWSSNGYVYHTALDTAERVSPAVLQRTGDNVLALARGMLSGERLSSGVEVSSRQPVYFDVVGAVVVSARAPAALLAAALALAALVVDVHLASKQAARELFISRVAWWRACVSGACVCACACVSGLVAAGAVALLLHTAGARLAFYSRPLLLAPLYAAPALCVAWCVSVSLSGRWVCAGGARGAGWWRGRAVQQGGALLPAAALFLAAVKGLRSGFLPALWTLMPALAGLLSSWTGCWRSKRGGRQAGALAAWWWGAGALLPSLQTWYLALGSLRMFVPVAGRAGSTPLPPDVLLGVVCGALSLGACWWLVPVVCVSRGARLVTGALGAACLCACALVCTEPPHAAYSSLAPQRVMVFHTRRTEHAGASPATVDHVYWVPEMDVNTRRTLLNTEGALRSARPVESSRCVRWPYCGLPYYFPALGLVRSSLAAPAPPLPAHSPAHLQATVTADNIDDTHAIIHIHIQQGPAHVVLSVSPRVGVCVVGSSAGDGAAPLPSAAPPPSPDRMLYFFSLHSARRAHAPLALHLARCGPPAGPPADLARGALLSLAGHALYGARAPEHERLLRGLPPWTAPTGWTVDLHLHAL